MSMRITTNMVKRNYLDTLYNTTGDLERKRQQVSTGRKVFYSYQNPSASAKSAVLDRRYARNADYQTSGRNAKSWLTTQENVITSLVKDARKIAEYDSVAALSDPTGTTGREAYAKELREIQNNMVYALNTQYGDAYVMAGNDGAKPPFEIAEDGSILYRGVDVDKGTQIYSPVKAVYSFEITGNGSAYVPGDKISIGGTEFEVGSATNADNISTDVANDPELLATFVANHLTDPNYEIASDGNKVIFTAKNPGKLGGKGPDNAAGGDDDPPAEGAELKFTGSKSTVAVDIVQIGSDTISDFSILKQYSNDHAYVDLGFGMKFDDDGNVVPSSAFDTAMPGINVVGYGLDSEGTSNNMISLVGQMAELLEQEEFDSKAYEKLWTKFKEQYDNLENQYTVTGAKYNMLESTLSNLETEEDNIVALNKETVGIDEEKAITDYSYAYYAYNVALKIGTSLLSPSLLDFMS